MIVFLAVIDCLKINLLQLTILWSVKTFFYVWDTLCRSDSSWIAVSFLKLKAKLVYYGPETRAGTEDE